MMAASDCDLTAPESGRTRILRAGLALSAEGGPAGMTIRQVCQRAGVKPPAVYHHFGSKDGLLGAVLEELAGRWLADLEALQPPGADLGARVGAAVEGWQAMIEAPERPLVLLLSVQLQSAEQSPEIRSALERVFDSARRVIARGLTAVGADDATADDAADQALGLVQAAALGFHLDGDSDRLRRRLVRIGHVIERLVSPGKE